MRRESWIVTHFAKHGFMDEHPISRQYTDPKISTGYAVSSAPVKTAISRDCLGVTRVSFNTRIF